MAHCQDRYSDHGEERLVAGLVKSERSSHHSKAESADSDWKDESMLVRPPAECDRSQQHCQRKANLMDDRLSQKSAGGSNETEEHGRRQAMDKAQA